MLPQHTYANTNTGTICRMDNTNECVPVVWYLFGAVASTEEGVTAFPAALERLQARRGVVLEQVLLEVLHHTEDQRATVPL